MTLWPSDQLLKYENTGGFEGVVQRRKVTNRSKNGPAAAKFSPSMPSKALFALGLARNQPIARDRPEMVTKMQAPPRSRNWPNPAEPIFLPGTGS